MGKFAAVALVLALASQAQAQQPLKVENKVQKFKVENKIPVVVTTAGIECVNGVCRVLPAAPGAAPVSACANGSCEPAQGRFFGRIFRRR